MTLKNVRRLIGFLVFLFGVYLFYISYSFYGTIAVILGVIIFPSSKKRFSGSSHGFDDRYDYNDHYSDGGSYGDSDSGGGGDSGGSSD